MDKLKYSYSKKRAIKLRRKGFSYGEIAKKMGIAKSTLSFWLKTVSLTREQKECLYTKNVLILARGPQSQKERRIREINTILGKAEKEIKLPLSFETYRLIGAALYWAEGSKTSGFKITNSDPDLILFMVKWLKRAFDIPPEKLKVWLNVYPQQNESKIKQFWSRLTNIPLENFGKSFVKPLNKNFKKNNLYYGTISIKVPKGTDMRYQVFGWIKTVLKDTAPKIKLVQKEWKSLKEVPRPANIRDKLNFSSPH